MKEHFLLGIVAGPTSLSAARFGKLPCFSGEFSRCHGQQRHVSDLLKLADLGTVLDPDDLRLAGSHERILYCAHRDLVLEDASEDEAVAAWPLDCVCFTGGTLSTGEFIRSIGHWNPPDEWEIFAVVQGKVFMVVQSRGSSQVHVLSCVQGETYALLPGCWHTSYAPIANTIVVNRYSTSDGPEPSGPEKYRGRVTSPLLTLIDAPDSATEIRAIRTRKTAPIPLVWNERSDVPVVPVDLPALERCDSADLVALCDAILVHATKAEMPFARLPLG
jgi:hypothetical protein